jgi:hypothetical protein
MVIKYRVIPQDCPDYDQSLTLDEIADQPKLKTLTYYLKNVERIALINKCLSNIKSANHQNNELMN